jgi:hypothetical protein
MFRTIIIGGALLLAGLDGGKAQSPAERGNYLVNTIMACGNCPPHAMPPASRLPTRRFPEAA